MFGLVPEKYVKRVSGSLVKYLENANFHLTTGFLGTPYLCHVLSENGQLDAAYRLLLQTDYPSWLYQITKGATTIWEHWDGIKPDGTFWSADMNSFNHYAYGAIGDWMYRIITGINIDEANPGYKHILITPRPGGNLSFASAELDTMYGTVKSSWKIDNGKMQMEVLIPHNTKATVVLPGAKREKMSEESLPTTDFAQITETESGLRLELGSGHYTYEYVI
jgi:alpha-L-rhamnosidase